MGLKEKIRGQPRCGSSLGDDVSRGAPGTFLGEGPLLVTHRTLSTPRGNAQCSNLNLFSVVKFTIFKHRACYATCVLQ